MWLKNVRYLDYNAGSGLSELVQQKLIALFNEESGLFLANPSSKHRLGQRVNHFIYQAKLSIAKSLRDSKSLSSAKNVTDEINEIVNGLLFTSSGTEANQTAIRSAVAGLGNRNQLQQLAQGAILGASEHSATLDLIPDLDDTIPFLRVLPLLPNGQYDFKALEALLQEAKDEGLERVFLTLSWANNETGVLLDLPALQNVRQKSPVEILLHLDGAQAWGKTPVHVLETGADYITFSGHKIGAPAGVGVLWKKQSAPFHSLIIGAQQGGKRGGTENSLGLIALGFAAELIDPAGFERVTKELRDRLEAKLKDPSNPLSSRIQIWGEESPRVGNTSRIGFKGYQKYQNWVELLDLKGFAVSHGSACKSEQIEPSRVLLAMGATPEEALNSIRISLGTHNTIEDIDLFVDTLLNMTTRKEAPKEATDEA